MRWWEELIPEDDRAMYEGFRYEQPKGRRPCLLMIDCVKGFVKREEYVSTNYVEGLSCPANDALDAFAELLAVARVTSVPIVHTRPSAQQIGVFGVTVKGEREVMGLPMRRPGAVDFAPEAAPEEGEAVLEKTKASAFFGTPLLSFLHERQADCVVVAGGTASGCLRASVVDAFSYGFPVFVVEEAVFDRARISHAVGLYEMNAKYADVLPLRDVKAWFGTL